MLQNHENQNMAVTQHTLSHVHLWHKSAGLGRLIFFLIPRAKKCVGNVREWNLSAPPIWHLQKYSLTVYYPFSECPGIALFLFLSQDWIWEIRYILPALCRTYPAERRPRSQTFQNGNPFHSPEKSLPPFPALQYSSSFHERHISGNVMQATKSEPFQPPAASIYMKQYIKNRTVRETWLKFHPVPVPAMAGTKYLSSDLIS